MSVFKDYDIRGNINKITPEFAYNLGLVFGKLILENVQKNKTEDIIFIGKDGRLSSPILSEHLIKGLLKNNLNVVDIGLSTTPILYFATKRERKELNGIQITASHNPKDDNGFKLVLNGEALFSEQIQDLKFRIKKIENQNNNLESNLNNKLNSEGKLFKKDIFEDYKSFILNDIKLKRKIKVIIDCGNGIAGKFAPEILRKIGCEVIELFSEVDGNFPNHEANPSEIENLQDLILNLKNSDAEFGLAFDGDGDRLIVVNKNGQIIYPDRLLILLAKNILKDSKKNIIMADIKCSANLNTEIKKLGGKLEIYKCGHSLIKAKMNELDSILGGETSGHIFFNDNRWFGFDDGIYVACRLLEILSETKNENELNNLLNNLPKSFSTPEIYIDYENPKKLIEKLKQNLNNPLNKLNFSNLKDINQIDGLRFNFNNGFALIRASNTTSSLMFRFEGKTKLDLKQIHANFLEFLTKENVNLSFNKLINLV